jgi:hypothetical protein
LNACSGLNQIIPVWLQDSPDERHVVRLVLDT